VRRSNYTKLNQKKKETHWCGCQTPLGLNFCPEASVLSIYTYISLNLHLNLKLSQNARFLLLQVASAFPYPYPVSFRFRWEARAAAATSTATVSIGAGTGKQPPRWRCGRVAAWEAMAPRTTHGWSWWASSTRSGATRRTSRVSPVPTSATLTSEYWTEYGTHYFLRIKRVWISPKEK